MFAITYLETCVILDAPDNGNIYCSLGSDGVPTSGDKCTFTCNDGYVLRGSTARKCWVWRGKSGWTGDQTECTEGNNVIGICLIFMPKLKGPRPECTGIYAVQTSQKYITMHMLQAWAFCVVYHAGCMPF